MHFNLVSDDLKEEVASSGGQSSFVTSNDPSKGFFIPPDSGRSYIFAISCINATRCLFMKQNDLGLRISGFTAMAVDDFHRFNCTPSSKGKQVVD